MKLFIITAAVFFSAALTVSADDKNDDHRGKCKEDVKKFCSGVKPGQGRIVTCLKAKESELSESCKAHFDQRKEEIDEVKQSCKEDRKNLCRDVKPGEGRIYRCLSSKEAELSEACRSALAKNKK